MSVINDIRRRFSLYRWVFVITWRVLGGHWFVFRDAPDWVVEACAELKEEADGDQRDETFNEVVRQAVFEWRLRTRGAR